MEAKWILVIFQGVAVIICFILAIYTTRNCKKIKENYKKMMFYNNGKWETYDEYSKRTGNKI